MFTAPQVEEMIRDTGGVPVLVRGVSTWGHLSPASKHRFGAGGGDSADGGTSPSGLILSIPFDVPGLVLSVGDLITYDGTPGWVRAFREDPEGLQTRILLAERTHVVSFYRQSDFGLEDEFGNERPHWITVAENVEVNLEPEDGGQTQDASGILTTERWSGFFPPDTGAIAGDRVRVISGFGPDRYRIDWMAPHGPSWDGRARLVRTFEVFP